MSVEESEFLAALVGVGLLTKAATRPKRNQKAEAIRREAIATAKARFAQYVSLSRDGVVQVAKERRRVNWPSRQDRLSRVQRATPKWADHAAIAEIYRERDRITAETGIPHHVDHIYPIAGETVCGLHVHWNMRVIPASENIKKGAKVAH